MFVGAGRACGARTGAVFLQLPPSRWSHRMLRPVVSLPRPPRALNTRNGRTDRAMASPPPKFRRQLTIQEGVGPGRRGGADDAGAPLPGAAQAAAAAAAAAPAPAHASWWGSARVGGTMAKAVHKMIFGDIGRVPRARLFGQDCVLEMRVGAAGHLIILADGNSDFGERCSLGVAEFIADRVVKEYDELLTLCLSGADGQGRARDWFVPVFADADRFLCDRIHVPAGSTCSCILVLQGGGRRFVLYAYVGDSPCFMAASDGSFVHLSHYEHSPDNIQEWLRDVERSDRLGFALRQYTFHRANADAGKRVPYPETGRYEHIPVWVRGESATGWVVNRHGLDVLHSVGMPLGGCQAIRRYVIKAPDGSVTGVMPGHEHENMANTVACRGQCTRCFGNQADKPQVDVEPTTGCIELNAALHYVFCIASDGVTDLWWLESDGLPPWAATDQVMEPFLRAQAGHSSEAVAASLREQTLALAARVGGPYKVGWNGNTTWDDCSCIVMTLRPSPVPT